MKFNHMIRNLLLIRE